MVRGPESRTGYLVQYWEQLSNGRSGRGALVRAGTR